MACKRFSLLIVLGFLCCGVQANREQKVRKGKHTDTSNSTSPDASVQAASVRPGGKADAPASLNATRLDVFAVPIQVDDSRQTADMPGPRISVGDYRLPKPAIVIDISDGRVRNKEASKYGYVMYQDIPADVKVELRLAEEEAMRHTDQSFSGWLKQALADIGGGTGATVGGTGSSAIDRDLIRRMRYQDKVVLVLLLLAFMFALAFCASVVYGQSFNNSAVTYYADPRFHTMTVDSHDLEDFLMVFNQSPRDMQLQVIGMVPITPFPAQETAVDWIGHQHRVSFAFALDLSPWVTPDGASAGFIGAQAEAELGVAASLGIKESDLQKLREFLRHNRNDLAMVEMVKEVAWPEWEELATNIKQRIRQAGFSGIIDVRRADKEVVTVYKNKPWANFLHNRTTKVLLMLSVVGWLFYLPYMWIRNRSITVSSRFRIDVPIETYWSLICDKIGPNGFDPAGAN